MRRRNPVAPVPARGPGSWPGVRGATGPLVLRNEAEKARKDSLRASATVTVRAAKYSHFPEARSVFLAAVMVGNRNDEIMVSPVFADPRAGALSGIVLAGQDIVIYSNGTAWGDEHTLNGMAEEDWEFLVSSGFVPTRGHLQTGVVGPIPSRVTSRPRSLAYYDPLLKPGNGIKQDGLPVLQRWAAAIEAVADGVDLVDSLVGSLGRSASDIDRVVDLTLDDVLRSGDVDRMQSWSAVAHQLVDESRHVLAKRQAEWQDRATVTKAPDPSAGSFFDAGRFAGGAFVDLAAASKAASSAHYYVDAQGNLTQNVGIQGYGVQNMWLDEAFPRNNYMPGIEMP